ncbi:MAG: EpsG family protein [Candidatus Sphingomonas colombiensis]|nr:EpsG family protein [Sphingomonas sp.]WEK44385.1 MAG: EpsG family protein [Sphingomonas sp.]
MIGEERVPARSSFATTNTGYWVAIAAIGACIGAVWLTTKPGNFADVDTYILYLDQLIHFPPANWWYFEAFSNFYLILIHLIQPSVQSSVFIAHYILGITFIFLLIISFPPRISSWQSIFFFFCILGPVLAFVTLRATPAYFLISASVFRAMRRDPRAWIYVAVAFLFHASTLLALPPMLLLYFQKFLPQSLRGKRAAWILAIAISSLLVATAIFPQITSAPITLIQSTSYLSKYIAYTDEVLPTNHVTSISHYVFMVFVVLLTISFLISLDDRAKSIIIYVISSSFVYLSMFMALSPVAAFRQAPFFLIPMISLFPWQKFGIKGPVAFLFILACAVLFVFQFDQVYI